MAKDRIVTVRLSEDSLSMLEALAAIDDETLAHEIRAAVNSYVTSRQQAPDFPEQIAEFHRRRAAVVEVFEKARAASSA